VEVVEVVLEMLHHKTMLKVVAEVLVLFTQRIQQSHRHKENPQLQSHLNLIRLLSVLVVRVPPVSLMVTLQDQMGVLVVLSV
jgi:hypothetical protein